MNKTHQNFETWWKSENADR